MEVEFDIIRRLSALSEDFYRACGRTSGSFVAVVRSASTSCDARRLLSGDRLRGRKSRAARTDDSRRATSEET
jgi:hypothetical protein